MRDKAKAGDLGAARMLLEYVEIRKTTETRKRDQRLLELLTPAQRACIEAVLREEPVSPDLALSAWVTT